MFVPGISATPITSRVVSGPHHRRPAVGVDVRKNPGGSTAAAERRSTDGPLHTWIRMVGVFLLLAVVGLGSAFVPHTVAEGGAGDDAWRLRVAPGLTAPSLQLEGPGGDQRARGSGLDAPLDATVVWQTDGYEPTTADATAATVVVGPTPRRAGSIRVTSVERGVGEAIIERVLWRRVHVAVLPADVWVTDLIAIGPTGEVQEVVSDLPPPPIALPEPAPTS